MRPFKESIGGKRVSVIGGGVSGISAARLLCKLGSKPFVSDKGTMNRRNHETLKALGIPWEEGGHTDRALNADMFVLSPGVSPRSSIMRKIRESAIPYIGEMELGWRYLHGPVAAITGTNGKTTVIRLCHTILKGKGGIACGNVGSPVSDFAGREGIFILEASSFQLHNIHEFRPDVAAVLNVSPDHMDWHQDFREYREAKARIFLNQHEKDALVLNADDPETSSMAGRAGSNVYFFSLEKEVKGAFLRGNTLMMDTGQKSFRLCEREELRVFGLHNVANALAASMVAFLLGAEPKEIRSGLAGFRGLPHRLEYVGELDGVRFINDSKSTNPHSVLWALRSMNKDVVLIMGGLDKDLDFIVLRKAMEDKVKTLVVLGHAAPKLESCFGDMVPVVKAESLKDAVLKAKGAAERDTVVLFSPGCASFDMFRDYRDRGEQFRKIVQTITEK